jgi:anti-anti-sigma factor
VTLEHHPNSESVNTEVETLSRLVDTPPLQILVSQEEDGTHIALSGELDGFTSEILKGALESVDIDVNRDLHLDLGGLTFIDSSGLALLISLHQQTNALIVRNPTDMARRLFQITGLDRVLTIEP